MEKKVKYLTQSQRKGNTEKHQTTDSKCLVYAKQYKQRKPKLGLY